jgi:hypothetical protein
MTGTTPPASDPAMRSDSTGNDKRMHALPGFRWTWEYARRNRVLQQSWQNSAAHFGITDIGPKARLIIRKQARLPLDNWHCLYVDNVHRDARQAAIIWDPSLFRAIVPMIALPAIEKVAAGVVDLTGAPLETTALKCFDGAQHGLYRDGMNASEGTGVCQEQRSTRSASCIG